jgi:hypothetical protein
MNMNSLSHNFRMQLKRVTVGGMFVVICAESMRLLSFVLRAILLVTALITGSVQAAAPAGTSPWFQGKFTGEEMLAHCRAADSEPIQDFGRGICTGFLDGFAAGHFVAETWHGFHHREEKMDDIFGHLCVPESKTRGQLARVFVQFLERNPEKLKLPAGLLLEDALRESFPCPK